MDINPQDKALLITFSSAAFLLLSFFFLGFSPFQNKIPQKFYEIPLVEEPPQPPEQPQSPEKKEKVEKGPISHQAINSSRIKKEANRFFNQEDEVREALQSEAQPNEDQQQISADDDHYMTDYRGRIAALRKKMKEPPSSGQEKKAPVAKISSSSNKRTTITYNLIDRNSIKIPNPVYTCDAVGKVVINIEVANLGNVVKTSFNRSSSTTTNGCLVDQALKYASKAIFNSAQPENQIGTITFEFQG